MIKTTILEVLARYANQQAKLYPNDENAYDVLAHIKKTGNSRGRSGIHAAIEAKRLEEQRKNHKSLKTSKRR